MKRASILWLLLCLTVGYGQTPSEEFSFDPVVTPSISGMVVGEQQHFSLSGPDGRPMNSVKWRVRDPSVARVSGGDEATATALTTGERTITAESSGSTADASITVYEGTQLPIGVARIKVAPLPGDQAISTHFGDPQRPGDPRIWGEERTADGSILIRGFTAEGTELFRNFVTKGTGHQQQAANQREGKRSDGSLRSVCSRIKPGLSRSEAAEALASAGHALPEPMLGQARWEVTEGMATCVIEIDANNKVSRARLSIEN
jgi:hypothetical protein